MKNIKPSCRFLRIFGQGLPEFALSKPSWLVINGGPAPPRSGYCKVYLTVKSLKRKTFLDFGGYLCAILYMVIRQCQVWLAYCLHNQ